ncbi:DNA repair protein RecO [Geomonas sp. Red69]|uniref:DNA repair protein RecO n=1 Tax=Geomonas diazotrophica TaxID=2843197 RepID=UPI001C10A847|nr:MULTISPECIES: DNA repair protein RecO [Geomonas]MBU5636935.1 DNA repair protein RecO [Geomonas diazotrophica]QXE87983.1 DNA repair protein RecO [Geomonas nitrogeniifigens]
MKNAEAEGIVLRLTDFGEADRIVTLFTLEQGKLQGVARGAKRSKKRFAGALDPFAHLKVQLHLGHGLPTISGADIVGIFPGIRADLAKIGCAAYACELVERLTPEEEPSPRLFRLLYCYLERLNDAPASPSDRRFFAVNLLKILGYQPELQVRGVSEETASLLARAMQTGRFGAVLFPDALLHEADLLLNPAIDLHLDRELKSLAFLKECCV